MLWTRTYTDDDRRCSFCRKPEEQAGELIPSPGTPLRFICADCVAVCNRILEDRGAGFRRPTPRLKPGEVITVKYTPAPRTPPRSRL